MKNLKKEKIVFFEADNEEKTFFERELSHLSPVFSSKPLNQENLEQYQDCTIASIFVRSVADKIHLSKLPNLKFIATRSTGFNHVDLDYCNQAGIKVANVPIYGENTVAEHTFALILALSRNLHKAYLRTLRGDFSIKGLQGFDLKGKTLGVIGAGNIGLHVIKMAKGFGMNVLVYDINEQHFLAEVMQFKYTSLEYLLKHSDIISLHAPLNEKTKHLINSENIKLIKRGALLINTARGELVDTNALVSALDQGILRGAGLDVLEGENYIVEDSMLLYENIPTDTLQRLLKNHILMDREDVVITPHIGFNSIEATKRILTTTVTNILSFLEGNPVNLINETNQ